MRCPTCSVQILGPQGRPLTVRVRNPAGTTVHERVLDRPGQYTHTCTSCARTIEWALARCADCAWRATDNGVWM